MGAGTAPHHRRRTPASGDGRFLGVSGLVFLGAVVVSAVATRDAAGAPNPPAVAPVARVVTGPGPTQDPAERADSARVPGWSYAGLAAPTVLDRSPSVIREDAWVLPVAGPYRLTARFGECSALWSRCHTGLDLAAAAGTPVTAVADGVITSTGEAGAYGIRTVQTLSDGTQLWYCHQSAVLVRTGDRVTRGESVGRVGATGNVTGPHLHLEVRPGGGDPVDPYPALVAHGAIP